MSCKCSSRCAACALISRRQFISTAAMAAGAAAVPLRFAPAQQPPATAPAEGARRAGAASKVRALVHACFVRRKGPYGMRWPGAVYDGEAALSGYTRQIEQAASDLKIRLELRRVPLYSAEEADRWLAEAAEAKPDGLLVVLLDRQEHAWPTAARAVTSGIPTVVFSPVGTSFTTNTAPLAGKTGCFICSTDDFAQVRWGMKMLAAAARLRATRCLVLAGKAAREQPMAQLGITLQYLPAATFLERYEKTPESPAIVAMADAMIAASRGMHGATRQDVINGVRSYAVAASLLEEHRADAISMDCLGALGRSKVSLPCIAWSKMNDDGIPAACEADVGAIAAHVLVQYLFDRPGFQQDPVADTARDAIIGSHCSCPTRLAGFDKPPEPYDIVHHHGMRDATARPTWRPGQRVTMADVLPSDGRKPAQVIVAAGSVLDNVAVPPAGGCVVAVRVKFDGNTDVLSFPGFHQVFFYGDFRRELLQFCRLFGLEAVQA